MTYEELIHELRRYQARHLSRESGRRFRMRGEQFLAACRSTGARSPGEIGRIHAYAWIEAVEAPTTRRDRYYVVAWVWGQLERGKPTFALKLWSDGK